MRWRVLEARLGTQTSPAAELQERHPGISSKSKAGDARDVQDVSAFAAHIIHIDILKLKSGKCYSSPSPSSSSSTSSFSIFLFLSLSHYPTHVFSSSTPSHSHFVYSLYIPPVFLILFLTSDLFFTSSLSFLPLSSYFNFTPCACRFSSLSFLFSWFCCSCLPLCLQSLFSSSCTGIWMCSSLFSWEGWRKCLLTDVTAVSPAASVTWWWTVR